DNSMSALVTLNYGNNNPITQVDLPKASIASPPNPALRWERVRTVNLGLDFTMAAGRVNGSVDYYIKNTYDLIERYPLDLTTGATAMMMNVGNTISKGVDVKLTTRNLSGG